MNIFGALERKDAQFISGWLAIEPSARPHQIIEIVIDGKAIGWVEASRFRSDVQRAGFGAGQAGFFYQFPPDVEPAKAKSARVRLAGTDLYLEAAGSSASEPPPDPLTIGAGAVFILGPARSGTSITFRALQSALRLPALGEGHVMPIFQRMLFSYYQHVRKFAAQEGVLAGRLDVNGLVDHMLPLIRRFYFDQFRGEPFIDKTPGLEALTGALFVKKVFPGAKIIITMRNGVEVVESYRRKFNVDFQAACVEWARCAEETAALRTKLSDALFLDQNEMRASPETSAQKIADHVGRPDKAGDLARFLRTHREDVLSDGGSWATPSTVETIGWTEEEKSIYRARCEPWERKLRSGRTKP